jgi:hypothetical protein
MARPVQVGRVAWACLALGARIVGCAARGAQPSAAAASCAGASAASADLRGRVEASPLYRYLAGHHGPLTPACDGEALDGTQAAGAQVDYRAHDGAALVVRSDPRIEYFDARLVTPGMNEATALALLEEEELFAVGPSGCGIVWSAPAETTEGGIAGSREVVYRGDACNCQARVTFTGDSVVAAAFRIAC